MPKCRLPWQVWSVLAWGKGGKRYCFFFFNLILKKKKESIFNLGENNFRCLFVHFKYYSLKRTAKELFEAQPNRKAPNRPWRRCSLLHCNCEMPSRTRKSDKVIAQPCSAAACVWWGRRKCAWKLWGNSERYGGSSFLSPTKTEVLSLYPLENAEIQICSTPQWHRTRGVSPFLLRKLLTFYAICWLSMQFSTSQIWKTPFKIWFLRSSTPLVSLPHLISPSKTSQDKHSESR